MFYVRLRYEIECMNPASEDLFSSEVTLSFERKKIVAMIIWLPKIIMNEEAPWNDKKELSYLWISSIEVYFFFFRVHSVTFKYNYKIFAFEDRETIHDNKSSNSYYAHDEMATRIARLIMSDCCLMHTNTGIYTLAIQKSVIQFYFFTPKK